MSAIDPHGVPTHAEDTWLLLAVVGLLGALVVAAGVLAVDHGWLPLPFGGGR